MGLKAATDRVGEAARRTRRSGRAARRRVRRITHANGAGRSGLGSLIEACAVNSAADALIAVSLAGTLFFGLDVNQARGQVALYLLVTMAPFALVAPLIGPALDRMHETRRFAIAGTFVARGLLCWAMAGAVIHGDTLTFLPAAFGALVLSKAFGVLRSAVMPQVLPKNTTLVTANARASFAGLITAAVVAPVGLGLNLLIGPDWLLRIAAVVFAVGAIVAMRLPRHIDSAGQQTNGKVRWRTMLKVGPVVGEAMAANAVLRAFSGFLILYLAFKLRTERFDPVSPGVALGLMAAAAGIGGLAGTATGARARNRAPRLLIFGTLITITLIAVGCAIFFGLWTALLVSFAGGFGQALGKLALDAIVQREIGEEIRSSTFAVSETLHQLVWVLGGLLGLAMSGLAGGRVALGAVAALMALALAALMVARARRIGAKKVSPRVVSD